MGWNRLRIKRVMHSLRMSRPLSSLMHAKLIKPRAQSGSVISAAKWSPAHSTCAGTAQQWKNRCSSVKTMYVPSEADVPSEAMVCPFCGDKMNRGHIWVSGGDGSGVLEWQEGCQIKRGLFGKIADATLLSGGLLVSACHAGLSLFFLWGAADQFQGPEP